jgi:subtilisin family serine protease
MLLLNRLRVGIFSQPREVLERHFEADSIMSDVPLFLPRSTETAPSFKPPVPRFPDETAHTWARQAVRAPDDEPTGRGVKVCSVDTGLQLKHPDFRAHRNVVKQGFTVSGVVNDSNGHGTHCAGIICGPSEPASAMPRYGVAPEVSLFVANIFGGALETSASLLFQAVEWAVAQGCDIVSLSLQRPVDDRGEPHFKRDLDKLEDLAQRALEAGTMLVSCTGNSSNRNGGVITGAAYPACCPSVLAVGGVDRHLNVMNRSNSGAEVFGPGEDVLSAWISQPGTRRLSGTSMAAAYVAGVAALLCQLTGLRGAQLLRYLRNGAGTPIKVSPEEPAARLVSA